MKDLVLRDYESVEDLRNRLKEMEKNPTQVVPDSAKYQLTEEDDWDIP